MMRYLLAASALVLVAPVGAQACAMDPYPYAVVFGSRAADIPEGYVAIQIEVDDWPRGSWVFVAKVVDGPSSILGKDVRIMPENLSSCTTFGRKEGYAVVSRQPVKIEGQTTLTAIAYERSWLDYIWHLFGFDLYKSPGKIAE